MVAIKISFPRSWNFFREETNARNTFLIHKMIIWKFMVLKHTMLMIRWQTAKTCYMHTDFFSYKSSYRIEEDTIHQYILMPFKCFPYCTQNITFSSMISLSNSRDHTSFIRMKYVALKKFKRKCKVVSNLNGKPTRNKPSLLYRILPYMCKPLSN